MLSSSPDTFGGVEPTSFGSFVDELILLFFLSALLGFPVM